MEKISDLEKRRLEIITDPMMIASEAKEAVIKGDKTGAMAKLQELVTIVRSKPYMDIPSSNDFTSMLQEEEEAAIEARDEFASLIDSKNYSDGDSETIEKRIDYLNLQISALEDKIRIANEEIRNIDTVEFQELTIRLQETEETATLLMQELSEYKIIIETEIEDKTPKRRAILSAAYDRKEKELENVQKIVDYYKADQKELIHKAYIIETERIKGFEQEITKHKNEITEMNILLADVSKAKDVLAIENDKQKLKELDTVVKNIKHRQKYSQTPTEIYDEIAIYLGTAEPTTAFTSQNKFESTVDLDKNTIDNTVMETEITLDEPVSNLEVETIKEEELINQEISDTEEIDFSERFKVVQIEPFHAENDTSISENSYIIGDYTDDLEEDNFSSSSDEVK